MRHFGQYTEQEVDAVIDRFELGFMRNRIKSSPSDLASIMNTMNGHGVVLAMRVQHLGRALLDNTVVTKLRDVLHKRGLL